MNQALIEAMTAVGLPPRHIPEDGKIHRFGERDKCWAVNFGDGAAFGDWSRGISEKWSAQGRIIDPARWQEVQEELAKARVERERERQQEMDVAAQEAEKLWASYSAQGISPYLKRKQVGAHGVKFYGDAVVIPLRDAEGKLWSLQTIQKDGKYKPFLKDGRKNGCFHIIGALEGAQKVFVCEGYATAASVHEGTGVPVIVAFDAYNFSPVVEAIQGKYPTLKLVIAADEDCWKPEAGNTGRKKAEEAVRQFDCKAIFPVFQNNDTKPTDWNDLHVLEGLEEVKRQIIDVTDVTDVQDGISADSSVTADVTDEEKDVTHEAQSLIPSEQERPCYRVFDKWVKDGDKKYRAGVYYFSMSAGKKDTQPAPVSQWICSPLHVDAVTFDGQNNNFGRYLRFLNTLGKWREWAMPMELLKGSGEDLRGELLNMGVEIDPHGKSFLATYLQSQHPKKRMRCALQVGWCEGSFVLPDKVIGVKSSDVIFQSGESVQDEYTCAGSMDGWQKEVAAYAVGNPLLITSLSSAFAGALLEKCNAESGGLHFVGDSSTGKTGLIEAACSVWGGGNYKRSWRATANGMEGVAAMFNDGLLALDEISECDPREVGAIVYALGNGRGKQRASRTGNARGVKRWRCMVLSSGERSIETTMAEGGNRMKAGQNTRLPSVPVAGCFGVWDDLHGMKDGAALTDAIKNAAKQHHGYAGRYFLERLTRDQRDFCAYWERIKALKSFAIKDGEGQTKRVAGRFALVAMAGELATEYGLTGWPQGAAISAVADVLKRWQKTCGGNSNDEKRQILDKVSAFIERHGDSRFSNETSAEAQIRDRAGWWRDEDGKRIYQFTAEGMREALNGFDFKRALDELETAGALPPAENNGERARAVRINGRLVKLYSVHAEKLGVRHES